jgi:hypothetical protein
MSEALLLTAPELAAMRAGTFQHEFPNYFTGHRLQTNGMIGVANAMEWHAADEPEIFTVNGAPANFNDHHINFFFADLLWSDIPAGQRTLDRIAEEVGRLGGLMHINHPYMHTGSNHSAARSSDANIVARYVELFMAHESIVGTEILMGQDGFTLNDRILWDNILKETMPQGRFVWGFSNDDSHSLSANGHHWNVMLMPELTEAALKVSMQTGAFYAIARRDRSASINVNGTVGGIRPGISNIVINDANSTITISATNYNRIEWIADGNHIHTGATLNIHSYSNEINSYVRAVIIGDGVAYTQPFGISVR